MKENLPEEDERNVEDGGEVHGRVSIAFACRALAKVDDCRQSILFSLICISLNVEIVR